MAMTAKEFLESTGNLEYGLFDNMELPEGLGKLEAALLKKFLRTINQVDGLYTDMAALVPIMADLKPILNEKGHFNLAEYINDLELRLIIMEERISQQSAYIEKIEGMLADMAKGSTRIKAILEALHGDKIEGGEPSTPP